MTRNRHTPQSIYAPASTQEWILTFAAIGNNQHQ